MISRMSVGISESESSPCAIVFPPGDSRAARSTSMWIHCSSPVASANLLIRSWVISIQSLTPTSVPTAALSSSNPLNIRMTSIHVRVLEFHFWDLVWNGEIGLGHRQNLGNRHARRRLQQGRLAAGKNDDRKFSHDEVDRPC